MGVVLMFGGQMPLSKVNLSIILISFEIYQIRSLSEILTLGVNIIDFGLCVFG